MAHMKLRELVESLTEILESEDPGGEDKEVRLAYHPDFMPQRVGIGQVYYDPPSDDEEVEEGIPNVGIVYIGQAQDRGELWDENPHIYSDEVITGLGWIQ